MTIEFLPTDSVYQEPSNGSNDGYARLYWMNGEPRLQTPGRFWTFPERMDEASIQLESPWKSIEHTFSDGAQKTLLASPALHLAPICWRQQNFLKDASGNVDSWLPAGKRGKFAPGEGVYFEMLTFVEGSTEAMVFSAKGTKTAMAWLASILPDYRKMRDGVRQIRGGKPVPPWWFWLAIRGALDAQKKPVYEKTLGNSYVTAPTWVHDDLSSRDTWKAMYVGNELAARGELLYQEAALWASSPISDSHQVVQQETPSGRNTPRPLEDDSEIPF